MSPLLTPHRRTAKAMSTAALTCLIIAAPQALPTSAAAPARDSTFAMDPNAVPAEADLFRHAGADRFETAMWIAKRWPSEVPVVYVANAQTFADTSVASSKAGSQGAPVIITHADRLPTATISALEHLRPANIVIVGNEDRVSSSVADLLQAHTSGSVTRIQGDDPAATAAAVADTYSVGPETVYLSSAEDFADGMTGAAVAGHEGNPLLFVELSNLPSSTAQQLQRLQPKELVVLGGKDVISDGTAAEAAAKAGLADFRRIGGKNRYETAALLAREMPDGKNLYAASGHSFVDTTTGAALAAYRGGPIVLVDRDRVPSATMAARDLRDPEWLIVLGGTAVVSHATAEDLATGGSPSDPPPADPSPDPAGWTLKYSTDFSDIDGWTARDETQDNDNSRNIPKNVVPGPDGLVIHGIRESGYNRPFTSGEVAGTSSEMIVPNYFRAEVEAQIMDESGLWPAALWFRPVDHPDGEIDVMEYLGGLDENRQRKRIAVTMHNEYDGGHDPIKNPVYVDELSNDSLTDMHTYTIEKTPDQIKVWIDDDEHLASYFNGDDADWWDRIMENPEREWYPRITLQIGEGSRLKIVPDPDPTWSSSAMTVRSLKLWTLDD